MPFDIVDRPEVGNDNSDIAHLMTDEQLIDSDSESTDTERNPYFRMLNQQLREYTRRHHGMSTQQWRAMARATWEAEPALPEMQAQLEDNQPLPAASSPCAGGSENGCHTTLSGGIEFSMSAMEFVGMLVVPPLYFLAIQLWCLLAAATGYVLC